MLKQTVQFTDFDGVNKTKNLYFNLTRSEVIDNIELKEEFENIQDMIGGATRDLEIHEVRLILGLVKKLMKLSYGIQRPTVDGDLKFTKNDPGIWEDFIETAYYDEFLIGLFENPERAYAFLLGIWPKQIMEKVDTSQLKLPGMPVPMDGQPLERPLQSVPDEPVVSTQSNGQGYSREALLAMPKDQFDEIAGTDPTKMTPELLQLAFIRKSSGE